jgi:multiple RNA-binding domain-containing protein 1
VSGVIFNSQTRTDGIIYQGAKDAPTPRPNKRPRLGPSPQDVSPPENVSKWNKDIANEPKSTSQLDEFLQVMQPRRQKGPAWANDMKQDDGVVVGKTKDIEAGGGPALDVALSDQDWMKQHMSRNIDVVEKAFEQSDDEDAPAKLVRRFHFRAVL